MGTETRSLRRMEGFLTFVVLQVGWFSCVVGAAWGIFWLGPIVVAVLCLLHLLYSATWRDDLKLMLALAVVGTAVDSLQSAAGLLHFRGAWKPWFCPLWISALWLHFGTMRQSFFRLLRGRPAMAAALGAVAGPLAYWAGVKLGALEFHRRFILSVASVALVWSVVIPVATVSAFRRESRADKKDAPS